MQSGRLRVGIGPHEFQLEASTTEVADVVRLRDRYGRQGTNAP